MFIHRRTSRAKRTGSTTTRPASPEARSRWPPEPLRGRRAAAASAGTRRRGSTVRLRTASAVTHIGELTWPSIASTRRSRSSSRSTIPSGDIDVETVDGEESVDHRRRQREARRADDVELDGQPPLGRSSAARGRSGSRSRSAASASAAASGCGSHARVPHASAADARDRVGGHEHPTAGCGRSRPRPRPAISSCAARSTATRRSRPSAATCGSTESAATSTCTSVSGDVRVADVGGSVEAKSVSGDVRVDSRRAGRTSTLQSVSGDIERRRRGRHEPRRRRGLRVRRPQLRGSARQRPGVGRRRRPDARRPRQDASAATSGSFARGADDEERSSRRRDVRLLLAGQTLSMFGDWVMIIVLGIWAKVLTGSNSAAGLVFFVFALGGLLAPIGGLVVDRLPQAAADDRDARRARRRHVPAAASCTIASDALAALRRHGAVRPRRRHLRRGARVDDEGDAAGRAARRGERRASSRCARDCASSRRSRAPGSTPRSAARAVALVDAGDVRRSRRRRSSRCRSSSRRRAAKEHHFLREISAGITHIARDPRPAAADDRRLRGAARGRLQRDAASSRSRPRCTARRRSSACSARSRASARSSAASPPRG